MFETCAAHLYEFPPVASEYSVHREFACMLLAEHFEFAHPGTSGTERGHIEIPQI